LETKSRILDVLGRREESAKVVSKAFDKATAIQLYSYARACNDRGTSSARSRSILSPKKMRIIGPAIGAGANLVEHGDFPTAAKEMTMAISVAPDTTKPFFSRC